MRAVFAIPGDVASLTGGYGYDREIISRCGGLGVQLEHLALPNGFPDPSADDLRETSRLLRALDRDTPLMIDGLAFGAFTQDLLRDLPRRVIALVHHPLALETGLAPNDAKALARSERAALACAARVIVTSAATRDLLVRDYDVAAAKIFVAIPGVARAPRAIGSQDRTHLLAVGSVTPRKAHDVLVEALAPLVVLEWRLTIAGSLAWAPDHAARMQELIAVRGLPARVTLTGEVDDAELARLYAAADLFVMPSLYEGYGMALTEALARGLPLVATSGCAALADAPADAVMTVPPGDAAALGAALSRAITDAALRRRMADAAWRAGQALPSWDDTARIIAGVIAGVSGDMNA